jgi:hypothetical protein
MLSGFAEAWEKAHPTSASAPAPASAAPTSRERTASAVAALPLPAGCVASGADYALPDGYYLKADGTVVCVKM